MVRAGRHQTGLRTRFGHGRTDGVGVRRRSGLPEVCPGLPAVCPRSAPGLSLVSARGLRGLATVCPGLPPVVLRDLWTAVRQWSVRGLPWSAPGRSERPLRRGPAVTNTAQLDMRADASWRGDNSGPASLDVGTVIW